LLSDAITCAAVAAYSFYTTRQISGLRELQRDLGDRNRKDSLQLLRLQNNLNALGLAMRDMLDVGGPYPLTAWSAQFDRLRVDFTDALKREEEVAVARRTPEQRQYLANSTAQFWDAVDRMFALAAMATRTTPATRFGYLCRRDRRRSAGRSPGSSWRTTRARNRRRPASRKSTAASSDRCTGF
jgi:hypothetical protein